MWKRKETVKLIIIKYKQINEERIESYTNSQISPD